MTLYDAIFGVHTDYSDLTLSEQNDQFRNNKYLLISSKTDKGKYVISEGIKALPVFIKVNICSAVASYNNFNEDNDPYGEHNYGEIELFGNSIKVIWRIDYFEDETMHSGAEDPEKKCYRLLTIMLADEYSSND